MIRVLLLSGGALLVAGCATTTVALLPGEAGAPVGAVAVLDAKSEAERGVLDQANTGATAGGRTVHARPVDPSRYAALTEALPPPPTHYTLYFQEGTTELAPGSDGEFNRMLAEVAQRPGAEVQVTGHTDTLGSSEDNDELSRRRAREIRDALIGRGLDPATTRAAGRGERELLVPTEDGVREDRNRRVEVIVR